METISYFTFVVIILIGTALAEFIMFCLRKLARRVMRSCAGAQKFLEPRKRPPAFETDKERRQFLGEEIQSLFTEILDENRGFVLIITPSTINEPGDLITNLQAQHVPEVCSNAADTWGFYYGVSEGMQN